jgi:arabinogalactan endo-1,4-beta-galactosidase
MKQLAKIFCLAAACLAAGALPARAEFVKGVDLSLLQFIQDHGVEYQEAGQVKDPLQIFKDHGVNYVRLRLFLAPNGQAGQVNTLSYTLRLAKRVKAAGLKLLLDLHYSDGWADPGQQNLPAEWQGLSHPQLVERVYAYTRETLAAFRREGCSPDMVAVGNEITNGMLWPDGGPLSEVAKWNDSKNPQPAGDAKWDNLADLLKAGIRGVHDDDHSGSIKIMIHIDKGGSVAVSHWFFDHLLSRGVDFDVIGLSYYPFWHGSFADLRENLASLSGSYKKAIMVVETDYDNGGGEQKKLPYPLTPEGQKAFLDKLFRTVAATPGERGQGVFYWAPEWIMGKQWNAPKGSWQWAHRALFDQAGNALPALNAFEFVPPPPLLKTP